MSEQKQVEHFIPIDWVFPEDIVSRYATNLVVQHYEHEFIISFFELKRPIMLGEPDEIAAKFQELESAPAECVARVIVAADRMPEFIAVLQGNLDKYLEKKGE
jgi:hypothetical protein